MADDPLPRDLTAYIPGIGAESNATPGELVSLYADPTTHRLLVQAEGALSGFAEDSAHTTGDEGALIFAVRRDADTSLVDASGDYAPLQVNAAGSLKVVVTGGASNTQYAEDAGHSSGDTGTMMLSVRHDTLSALATTDLDYSPLQVNANGALWVLDVNSAAILAAVDGIEGLLTTIDGDTGTLAGAVSGTEMQVDVVAALPAGNNNIGDVDVASSALPTGAATSANQSTIIGHVDGIEGLLTTIDADTSALVALILTTQADDIANTADGLQVTSFGYMFDGTTWDRVRGDATNGLLVNLGANNDITGVVDLGATDNAVLDAIAASVAAIDTDTSTIIGHVDGIEGLLTTIDADTGSIMTAVQIMDDWDNTASDGASVSGDVAHDGVDAGEPVKIGGIAVDVGANGTDVAAADRTNAKFLRAGIQLVLGGHQNIISKNLNVTDADGAQTDTALVTVSAGTCIVVTKVSAMLDAATTATGGVAVRIGFGTANVPAADSAGIILAHPGIAAGSGVVEGNGAGIIGIGASNEDLRLTCEDPAGGNLDVIVTYFTQLIG